MKYNLVEQLAVIKALDEVILADKLVYEEEASFIAHLAQVLGFKMELIRKARKVEAAQAMAVLKLMSENKKHALSVLLREAAGADGRITDAELELIQGILQEIETS
ncbi:MULTISPECIES: TerB family tellurite resistance protein [unclassified Robiginitalea]|uniref:TerB family tellurite resistance protein n=1 Tax=Robiginitalea TaxID=252306 RepID=UPI00234A378B|nr:MULTISPECIES: TerB family tellurite resistance protein [unclassified Robiginitalea]MDC6353594.1 TerB family tellurite resistance protein [Robiginitalea sp. PM2]MDC6373241.1 TerB family tellurite resistance protein [Robiginitalea sp. SP8]